MDPGLSPVWVEVLKGGALLVLCVVVFLNGRDNTRILASLNRKQARTETLTISIFEYLTGKRVKRANTSPVGHPIRARSDSEDPPIAISRTTSEEDIGDG